MKLARKLYLYFIVTMVVVLSLFGFLSFRREARQLEVDFVHDISILGRMVAVAVTEAWLSSGQERAMAIISDANTGTFKIVCRWVWLQATDGSPLPGQLDRQEYDMLVDGESVVRRGVRIDGTEAIFGYFPVAHLGTRRGAIEISEPLVFLQRQSKQNAIKLAFFGAILTVSIGILGAITGQHLVGRRMQALVDMARRIGKGNWEEGVVMSGNDEIAELCQEMNVMAEQLFKTKKELFAETEARIAAIDQLRHSERLATLGKLSSGMAHEIGTPLNVVSGRAKMIAAGGMTPQELTENATIIVQQTERITGIMRQMLDYARRRPLHHVFVDIMQLVAQVFDMLKNSAKKQGVALVCEAQGTIPPIAVDSNQIMQVLINIAMNGIQSMPDGGTLTVTLAIERTGPPTLASQAENDYLAMRVRDTGEGIAPNNLDRIFDPFFTTKAVGKGTGLGLSIAQGIIQEHRGWIAVESELQKGSCVTIYLPLRPEEPATASLPA